MAKVSTLPLADPLTGSELVPVVQGGATKRASINALLRDTVGAFLEYVPTDAFTSVETDEQGYAFAIQGNDGIWDSANNDMLLGLVLTETIATDADIAAVLTDEDGWAFDVFRTSDEAFGWESSGGAPAALDDPMLSVPAGDALAAFAYGQSVFTGAGTAPISSVAWPAGDLKMFNGGMVFFDYADPSKLTSLVNAREAGVESAGRGMGESFLQFFAAEEGYALSADGRYLVLTVASEGGKRADELADGGIYFPRLKASVDGLAAIAAAGGRVPDVVHLVYCQGEADMVALTHPATRAATIENGIRKPFEAYCQSVFKRPTRVRMIITQAASHQYYNIADPAIALSDLDVCNTNPNYVLAGPMYQYDYGAAGVGSHLLDGTEVKWAAAMAGRALQRAARGVAQRWINPLRAWQIGLRTIMIEYDVPVEPLVIDTASVSDPGQRGFNVFSNSTPVAVSSVSVVARRCIRIVTSADIPAGAVRVDYAHTGGATGSPAGRSTGSRGCLRDSDPAIFDPAGINKPLWNWAPIHRVNIS